MYVNGKSERICSKIFMFLCSKVHFEIVRPKKVVRIQHNMCCDLEVADKRPRSNQIKSPLNHLLTEAVITQVKPNSGICIQSHI